MIQSLRVKSDHVFLMLLPLWYNRRVLNNSCRAPFLPEKDANGEMLISYYCAADCCLKSEPLQQDMNVLVFEQGHVA